MKAYIGCDPGKSGGIAIVTPNGAHAYPMPETERDLWDLLLELRNNDWETEAVVEKVHAMPGQGVTSMFTFGQGYGALRMALIGAGIPFHDVTPQRWQKDMGCLTKGDKNVSKTKAQQLFPQLKITHKVADALLMAKWLIAQPATH